MHLYAIGCDLGQVEYVSADFETELEQDEALAEFKKVFEKFSTAEELCGTETKVRCDGDGSITYPHCH